MDKEIQMVIDLLTSKYSILVISGFFAIILLFSTADFLYRTNKLWRLNEFNVVKFRGINKLALFICVASMFPIYTANKFLDLDLFWWEWFIAAISIASLNYLILFYRYIFKKRLLDKAGILGIVVYLGLMVISLLLVFSPVYTLIRFWTNSIDWRQVFCIMLAIPLTYNAIQFFSSIHDFLSAEPVNISRMETYESEEDSPDENREHAIDQTEKKSENKVKKTLKSVIGLLVLLCSIILTIILLKAAYDGGGILFSTVYLSKEAKLKNKIHELERLQVKLDKKQGQVKILLQTYEGEIEFLVKEIKSDKEATGIVSFSEAQKHSRIKYDIMLIQRKKAYISKLEEIQGKLQSGIFELQFLERQAADDLKMYKTLEPQEVEKIISEIDQTIDLYMPEAEELVVKVDPEKMESLEKIWQEINQ